MNSNKLDKLYTIRATRVLFLIIKSQNHVASFNFFAGPLNLRNLVVTVKKAIKFNEFLYAINHIAIVALINNDNSNDNLIKF